MLPAMESFAGLKDRLRFPAPSFFLLEGLAPVPRPEALAWAGVVFSAIHPTRRLLPMRSALMTLCEKGDTPVLYLPALRVPIQRASPPRRTPMDMFRSLLFVPGNREEMLTKAAGLPADALVPDLEDSVPDGEKEHAREIVREVVVTLAQAGRTVIPRINALDTGLARDDLAAVVGPHVYGVTVGKVQSAWEIGQVSAILDDLEQQAGVEVGHTRLIPWLESAMAIVNAYQIASSSPRIVAVAIGAEDFTNDMAVQRSDDGAEVRYARSAVAVAARAAGVLAIDTPYVNFRDVEGLEREVRSVLPLGFKAKFAIHPGQLETINTLFSPSEEELEYARRVVAAFGEAEAEGRGSTSLDGKMIDVPVVKRARNLLALAESMAKSAG